MNLDTLYFIIPLVIASTVPLALVALGALFSERSGVVNIALEGIMLMGAFVGSIAIMNLEEADENRLEELFISEFVDFTEDYFLTEHGIDGEINTISGELNTRITDFNPINKPRGYVSLSSNAREDWYADLTEEQKSTIDLYEEFIINVIPVYLDAVEEEFEMEFTESEIDDVMSINRFKELSDDIFGERNVMIALIGLLVGAVVGMLFSLLHAFASVNMKANQIISATALNMFAPAFAIFIARTFYGTQRVPISRSYLIKEVPFLSNIPFFGDLFFQSAYLSTFLGVLIFTIAIIILYKTKIGLRLRSCGENPHAADSLGINIYRIRYLGVSVSGMLAGIGGVIFVLSFSTSFNATVAGFGFLALAVLIFGNWKPLRIIFAALFFGFMRVISSTTAVIPFLDDLDLDKEIYLMLPYLATLVVLAFVSKNSAAPRAAGEPYDPGKR
jgi:simple sugar transport system permease protein